MVYKIIDFNLNLRTANNKSYAYETRPQVMTNDKNSVKLQFNVSDVQAEELTGATAEVLLFMQDGSFFQKSNSDILREGTTFSYILKPNEANHLGMTKVQISVIVGSTENASKIFEFEILGGLETKPIVEKEVQDWTTLTAEAKAFVDQIKDTTVDQFVELKMGEELQNLEANYAVKLAELQSNDASITAQLAETVKKTDTIPMAQMGQDVKEAMTGGSVAVVGTQSAGIPQLTTDLQNMLGSYVEIDLAFENGYWNSDNGSAIGNDPSGKRTTYPASEGDRFKYTGYFGVITTGLSFIDSNGVFLGKVFPEITEGTKKSDVEIICPANTAMIKISSYAVNETRLWKLQSNPDKFATNVALENESDRISEVEKNISEIDFGSIKVAPPSLIGSFDDFKKRAGYVTFSNVGSQFIITKPSLGTPYSDGVQSINFTPDPTKLLHVFLKGSHNITANPLNFFIWGVTSGFLGSGTSKALTPTFDEHLVFDPNYFSIYEDETEFYVMIISEGDGQITIDRFEVIQSSVLDTDIKSETLEGVVKNVDTKLSAQDSRITALEGGDVGGQIILTSPDGNKYVNLVQNTGDIVGAKLYPDKTLFLGNSLMFGWNMEFGMAAKNSKSDYYYHVKEKIKEYKPTATFTKLYTSPWESEVIARPTFITNNLNPVLTADTDLVVIQAGENVAQAGVSKFQADGIALVRHIRSIATKARVLFVGVWYPDTPKVNAIQEICRQTGAIFCNISDIYSPETTGEIGDVITYDNATTTTITLESQASHPGNAGMQMIADRIIASLGLTKSL